MTLRGTEVMATPGIYWAICGDCDWTGADWPSGEIAWHEGETHSGETGHDVTVLFEETSAVRFG